MDSIEGFSDRFAQALQTVFNWHNTIGRKDTEQSSLGHLLSVAGIVIEYEGSEDQAISALLHDAIEDVRPPPREQIRNQFGEEVLSIVEGCTDTDQSPKPPWRPRKERYLKHLKRAPATVRFVSCADKLANLRSLNKDLRIIGEHLWERFRKPEDNSTEDTRARQLWYYGECTYEFLRDPSPAMAPELKQEMEKLCALAGRRTNR